MQFSRQATGGMPASRAPQPPRSRERSASFWLAYLPAPSAAEGDSFEQPGLARKAKRSAQVYLSVLDHVLRAVREHCFDALRDFDARVARELVPFVHPVEATFERET